MLVNPVLPGTAEQVRPLVWAALAVRRVVRSGDSIYPYTFFQSPLIAPGPVKKPTGPGKKE